jgi:hypothetical protein
VERIESVARGEYRTQIGKAQPRFCDTSESVTLRMEAPALSCYSQKHEERIKKHGGSQIVLEKIWKID